MTPLQHRTRRPASERGFTLIELLVVIIILGILAAVVVFAVSGVGDKGKSSATVIDERTIRTAQEAYCAQKGRYANGSTLVAEGFLSDEPEYHRVFASQTGGNCNGWRYAVLRTDQATAYPQGNWQLTTNQPMTPPRFDAGVGNNNEYVGDTVRLADGRVLAISSGEVGGAEIWDPATNSWTDADSPPFRPAGPLAVLLDDDPSTPESECAGPVVNNCNKVLVKFNGCDFCNDPAFPPFRLFNPNAVPGAQWELVPKAAASYVSNSVTARFMLRLRDASSAAGSQCGSNCGKVFMIGDGGSGPLSGDLYDPRDNSFSPIALADSAVAGLGTGAPLADGRYLMIGEDQNTFDPVARFLEPATMTFSIATSPSIYHGDRFGAWSVLPSGEILFAGPSFEVGSFANVAQAEIYTSQPAPAGGTWRTVPNCNAADFANNQYCHVVGSLPDGRVLAFTGYDSSRRPEASFYITTFPKETFLFNPATERWDRAADLNDIFTALDGVLLDPAGGRCDPHCGKVLLVGGGNINDGFRSSSELFSP